VKCIAGSLERRFGADAVCGAGPAQAGGHGEQIALVIADIWAEEMSGIEWLERMREACPKAARVVLVGWGDGKGFLQVRRALVTGLVETFLIRPCDDPLFVLIGAGPHTDWMAGLVQRDEHGYLKTGKPVVRGISGDPEWEEDRAPYQFETSMPGRSRSATSGTRHRAGVTAAVYEGTTAVWSAREYLAEA
jgi:hypothetical protein